jgi:hypothetical protein
MEEREAESFPPNLARELKALSELHEDNMDLNRLSTEGWGPALEKFGREIRATQDKALVAYASYGLYTDFARAKSAKEHRAGPMDDGLATALEHAISTKRSPDAESRLLSKVTTKRGSSFRAIDVPGR